jgi:hypothetical protein
MSAFLGFESFLVPLGSTVANIQDTFKTALTTYGWQCVRQCLPPAAVLGTVTNPTNVFDMQCTYSTSSVALPLWVGCQMTNPFTPTAMYIQIGPTGTYGPTNFTLDWSDNGSSWTTHATFTGETNWGIRERRKYTITGAPAKNYWRLNVTARNGGPYLEIEEWNLEDASNNWITQRSFIDVIPPVTESIGNSVAREFIRLSFTSTAIYIRGAQELLSALPQVYSFVNPTAGAVTLSVTINGVTVSYTGSAPNTATQNARGLYEALRASMDANFLAWNWMWSLGGANILATQVTPSANINITSSNITASMRGSYSAPMTQSAGLQPEQPLTVDLINGWIYYLQVNNRGLALSTKTNSGFYGPVHMCYGDNASAIAQIPASDIVGLPCTPIELVVGTDDIISNTGATGRFTHWWSVSQYGAFNNAGQGNPDTSGGAGNGGACNVFTKHAFPYVIQDIYQNYTGTQYFGSQQVTLRSEGLFTGADSGVAWKAHKLICDPDTISQYLNDSYTYFARAAGPVFSNIDWYRIVGAGVTDEQMLLIPCADFITTLSSNITTTDVTIPVVSTTGFPSAGYLVIEGEVIQYTGVTSNTFTGCTRAKYSTTAINHFTGTQVFIGAWLVKMNTGLLFAGYVKPS